MYPKSKFPALGVLGEKAGSWLQTGKPGTLWPFRTLEKERAVRRLVALYRPVSLLAGLLCLVGFHYVTGPLIGKVWAWTILEIWICGMTMWWNDLQDRTADVAKGKTMSDAEYEKYYRWGVVQWIVIAGYSLGMLVYDFSLTRLVVLAGQIVIGIWLYTAVRRVMVVNNLVVAICAASPLLLGGPLNSYTAPLFLAAIMMITVREVIKDIEDVRADSGHKMTLPQLLTSDEEKGVLNAAIIYVYTLAVMVLALAGPSLGLKWWQWIFLPLLMFRMSLDLVWQMAFLWATCKTPTNFKAAWDMATVLALSLFLYFKPA